MGTKAAREEEQRLIEEAEAKARAEEEARAAAAAAEAAETLKVPGFSADPVLPQDGVPLLPEMDLNFNP